MGLAKRLWEESMERGWDAPDKHVCAECVEDNYLKSVIMDNVSENHCDYCNRTACEPIAAPLSAIIDPVSDALYYHFAEPGEAGLPRDTGEWIDEERITYTADALESLPLHCDAVLFDDIAQSFHNTSWYPCASGFWLNLHRHDELRYSWERFTHEVKHRSRFFFTSHQNDGENDYDSNKNPFDLLNEIGRMTESLELVHTIPAKTSLFRVRRAKSDVTYKTFEDVGPPPMDVATAGRMNPSGISYFYLALEENTALAEIVDRPPTLIGRASFMIKEDLCVLDLTKLPTLPSVFDKDETDTREILIFLNGFINAISEPIKRDGREHIEYVPSQVVSEFFAQVFRTEAGDQLDAVIYPSAVMPGGRNVVIFPLRDYGRQLKDLIEITSINMVEIQDWHDLYWRLGGKDT